MSTALVPAGTAGPSAGPPHGLLAPAPPMHLPGARKVKMAAVIDQGDDAEIVAWEPARARTTMAAYRAANDGEDPPPEDEPSVDQLSALEHKVNSGASPAADFAVWRPHGQRLMRSLKLTVHHLTPGGDYVPYEVPGPPTYEDWLRAWRVFVVAMVCLNAATSTRLGLYQRKIAALAEVFGEVCWWLVAQADARCRFEHLPRILRWQEEERALAVAAGRAHPLDPAKPWDHCFKIAAQDKEFWDRELERKAVLYITHLKSRNQLEDDGTGVAEHGGSGIGGGGSPKRRRRGGGGSGGGGSPSQNNNTQQRGGKGGASAGHVSKGAGKGGKDKGKGKKGADGGVAAAPPGS